MSISPRPILTESSRQTAQDAAAALLTSIDTDADVKAALAGRKTQRGHTYENYLAPDGMGRAVLQSLAEGKPARSDAVRDLMLSLRESLISYEQSFSDKPIDANGDTYLVAPPDGATSYYIKLTHPSQRLVDKGNPHTRSTDPMEHAVLTPDMVNSALPRMLDAQQKSALNEKLEAIRLNAAKALGRMQAAERI